MGRVLAPYGVRGWVKVLPQTAQPDGILAQREWWLGADEQWQRHQVLEGHVHGQHVVVALADIGDRDAAARLKGLMIAVPREALPAPAQGEYYWADLIGLEVTNLQAEQLGRVQEVFATGANDVLVVRSERERLIPFTANVIRSVDLASGSLVVDWGLDY